MIFHIQKVVSLRVGQVRLGPIVNYQSFMGNLGNWIKEEVPALYINPPLQAYKPNRLQRDFHSLLTNPFPISCPEKFLLRERKRESARKSEMKIGYATSALLLLAALLIGLPPPAMGNSVAEMGKCTEALVALSPCLPYVASPPNDLSSSPSTSCCRSFRASASIHSSSENRSEICLCVILRNPFVFGFPVNTTRITSLVSLCHLKTRRKTPDAYLRSLCIGTLNPFLFLSFFVIFNCCRSLMM